MPDQLQLRGGTTAQHASFTGASKEVTVDTTKKTLVVHDGSTAGGNPLLREDQSNLPTTAPTRGIYNASGSLAISTGGSGRLFINGSGNVGVGVTPSARFHISESSPAAYVGQIIENTSSTGYTTTLFRIGSAGGSGEANINYAPGLFFALGPQANDTTTPIVLKNNNGQERLRITSAGLVGVGTSSPSRPLHVVGSAVFDDGTVQATIWPQIATNVAGFGTNNNYPVALVTNGSQRLHVTATGNVGIGTASPANQLHIYSASGGSAVRVQSGTTYSGAVLSQNAADTYLSNESGAAGSFQFWLNGSERFRCDSSGRLLVGTSTSTENVRYEQNFSFVKTGANTFGGGSFVGYSGTSAEYAPLVDFKRSRGTTDGSMTVVASGDRLGGIAFLGADGNSFEEAANIRCYVDGTPGDGDMPGRLVFSTTADGASSPTERMRIQNDGNVIIGKAGQTSSYANPGISLFSNGSADFTRASAYLISVNRQTDDGVLVEFYQDNWLEGTISVSGTTVSYNGAHLSRWSQLPSGIERTEILRGTVLSNIDEMCEWGDEDNEQLNRMKVSDVEGDKNVSGVFQAWDDDDDTYTNDFYCAMTGDFIIRIGAGVTVERGDLLMSAGDGTAKPQDDDIIRSKTIAKITSTNVSCTYDDGSYCVPCVLMAC